MNDLISLDEVKIVNGFYQCPKGTPVRLSENFVSTEFDCHGSNCCTITPIAVELVNILQKIRKHFGKAVNVSSAYRCTVHNSRIKNASKTSKHLRGMAADITVEDTEPAEVAKFCESIGVLGIGLYERNDCGDHFVHVDTRTTKSFWYGHAQKYRSTFGGKVEVEVKPQGSTKEETANKESAAYTLKDFVLEVQSIIGAAQDGIAGPETLGKTITISAKISNRHALVKPIQKRLAAMGYSEVGIADGIAGSNFTKAVKRLQREKCKMLFGDGEITKGNRTWKVLLGLV